MTTFLQGKGVAAGTIAYFGTTTSVEHVAIKPGGLGGSCAASSKLGELVCLDHDLNELQGGDYGPICGGN